MCWKLLVKVTTSRIFYRSLHGQNLQRILHSFVDIWNVTMQRKIYVEPNTFYTILLLIFFRFRPYFFLPFFLYLSSSLVLILFILVLPSRHNNYNRDDIVAGEMQVWLVLRTTHQFSIFVRHACVVLDVYVERWKCIIYHSDFQLVCREYF